HRAIRCPADPCVVYPGNLQGRNVRECGPKGCVLVSVDDRGSVTTEFHPLDVLRWEICRVELDDAEDEEAVLARFVERLAPLVGRHDAMPLAVRVILSGRTPCDHRL